MEIPVKIVRLITLALLACFPFAARAATTIWAGTGGGVYKSIDSGKSWQVVTVTVSSPLLRGTDPQTPNAVAIALDPQQPSTVYFVGQMQGSNGSGFWRSTDNGKTWKDVLLIGVPLLTPSSYQTAWILVDPVLTNVIYLGWQGGVMKSADYGDTWAKLTMPGLPNSGGNTAVPGGLSVDPNTSGVLYLSALVYVFKSADFGSTWGAPAKVAATSNALRVGNVMVTPQNSSVIFAGNSAVGNAFCGPNTAQALCGIFRSADGGQNWNIVGPAGNYREVAFDPRNTDLYDSGSLPGLGVTVLSSADGGNNWNPVSNKVSPHLIADPGASASLFGWSWGNNAWFRSTDGGGTFITDYIVTTGTFRAVNMLTVPKTLGNVSSASLQSGPVAPQEIVSALGFDLATTTLQAEPGSAPATLGGTTVSVVDANGISRLAPLFYVSAGQINYEIPEGTAPGVATVIVKSGDGVVSAAPLGITPVAPGLYAINAKGLVAAYVLRVSNGIQSYENVYQLDSSNAVVPRPIDLGPAGDAVYMLLFGTGLREATDTTVTIGGVGVPLLFSGAQGQFPGEDQVNIGPLPRSLAGGGNVPLVLSAGGKTANAVNVTIK